MNEYQITFFVDNANASAHLAQPLNRVAKKFKSTLHIINVTQNRVAELTKSVAILQAGLQQGDLCQITAIGIDAELACFVIKDMIAEHFTVVGSHINYDFPANWPSVYRKFAHLVKSNGTTPKHIPSSPSLNALKD